MQKIKQRRMPLASVGIAIASMPVFCGFVKDWLLLGLLVLTTAVSSYLVMCLIRTTMIVIRIQAANANGDLDKWLDARGFPAHSSIAFRSSVEILLNIRDNPKVSEEDRIYAAFLTVSAPRRFPNDKCRTELPKV